MEGHVKRAQSDASRAEYEAELACPPMPMSLLYLWQIFRRLRRRKGSNGFGLSPIEWPDIDAFLRHAKIELTPWEIEVIEDLDDLILTDHSKPQSDTDG